MGKKLDALLGRSFKASKFRGTTSLALSRLGVLKNQRKARCSLARSDVLDFLNNAIHDRALLRVEQVIKEQNMLDVFSVLEGYCHLLLERVNLFEHNKFCPEELLEAVSTLIYASTRCGDFPELQELRAIFTTRFGREFAARAVELRNNCGVNLTIIQKLSTRMPSLEIKMKVLKEIASDNNIELPISSNTQVEEEEKQQHTSAEDERESGSSSLRGKYKDVADAAQAAFESAAYAAAAARIAVELSRSESTDPTNRIPAAQVTKKPDEENEDVRRSFSDSSSDSSDEEEGDVKGENATDSVEQGIEPLDITRRPISVRTTWARPR